MLGSIGRTISLLALLASAGGCWSGYYNIPRNDLSLSPKDRCLNINPQTESFVDATALIAGNKRPLRGPSTGTTLESAARAGTVGPPVTDADGYFVGLAISGGGLRSANFAAACMLQLDRIGMLQKVDCISAVSGGTLTAAYYCALPDSDWNEKALREKLTHSFTSNLIFDVLMPWNFFALTVGNLTRSDLLADHFSDVLYSHNGRPLTFHELRHDNHRPRLLINTTNLETGLRFTFDNSNFNELNSNLDKYPLSNAVAASSAVPVVMDPVALRDFSTSARRYVHLVDGGVCDNLGVQSLVESYEAQIQKPVNPYPNGAVLIVIDAGIPFNGQLASQAVPDGLQSLLSGLDLTSSVLVNRASSATLSEVVMMHSAPDYTAAQLRGKIDELHTQHWTEIDDSMHHKVRVYHLSLTEVGELTSLSFGAEVNKISTNFNISQGDTFDLYKAAEVLFKEKYEAMFSQILSDMNAKKPATN